MFTYHRSQILRSVCRNSLSHRTLSKVAAPQVKVPATYMRGGTSKGVFFRLQDLPDRAQVPGPPRDHLLMRVIGSPDPYGSHIDGMGGATSSTSKTVIVSPSTQPNHDVDYLFGQVATDKSFVDWSGNCGNLTAAVGAFAIHNAMLDASRIPTEGTVEVRIWQANIQKTILVQVPIHDGQVQETGDFQLDGVAFPAAEIPVTFIDPSDADASMFPTGNVVDHLNVPGLGDIQATMIIAGIPTIIVRADEIGYTGTELRHDVNSRPDQLAMLETIRAQGALQMGLIKSLDEAATRAHTPKLAFVAPPTSYTASSGKVVEAEDIDLCVRALSMGVLHHAMMGTAAVALGTAAAIPGTLVCQAAGGAPRTSVRLGHPSGTLQVGAKAVLEDGVWKATEATMSRSARRMMEGAVYLPGDSF